MNNYQIAGSVKIAQVVSLEEYSQTLREWENIRTNINVGSFQIAD